MLKILRPGWMENAAFKSSYKLTNIVRLPEVLTDLPRLPLYVTFTFCVVVLIVPVTVCFRQRQGCCQFSSYIGYRFRDEGRTASLRVLSHPQGSIPIVSYDARMGSDCVE